MEVQMKRSILICAVVLLVSATLVGAKQGNMASKGILRHSAVFNFKPDVPQSQIDKILADTRATLPTIPGATNIVLGPQTSSMTKYKYGMSIDFANKEAKTAYAQSPQSKRLHEMYKQFIEDEIVIDILSQ